MTSRPKTSRPSSATTSSRSIHLRMVAFENRQVTNGMLSWPDLSSLHPAMVPGRKCTEPVDGQDWPRSRNA
jgi:hypothetical protein